MIKNEMEILAEKSVVRAIKVCKNGKNTSIKNVFEFDACLDKGDIIYHASDKMYFLVGGYLFGGSCVNGNPSGNVIIYKFELSDGVHRKEPIGNITDNGRFDGRLLDSIKIIKKGTVGIQRKMSMHPDISFYDSYALKVIERHRKISGI